MLQIFIFTVITFICAMKIFLSNWCHSFLFLFDVFSYNLFNQNEEIKERKVYCKFSETLQYINWRYNRIYIPENLKFSANFFQSSFRQNLSQVDSPHFFPYFFILILFTLPGFPNIICTEFIQEYDSIQLSVAVI